MLRLIQWLCLLLADEIESCIVMKDNYVRTDVAEIWLGDDGIIRIHVLSQRIITLADSHENMKYIPEVSEGKICPAYIDIRNIMWSDQLSRKYAGSDDVSLWFSAVAIIVDSLASRMIGSFVLNFVKPPYTIRIFTSEKEALGWLSQFVE